MPTRKAEPRGSLITLSISLALSSVAFGCRPKPSEATVEPEPEPELVEEPAPEVLIPAEPANRSAGETLDATIPLVGGGALELASLRGRPVVVEISASWEPGWKETHAIYAELLQRHPELAVIVVASEPEDRALLELPAGLIGAWDPAGALAARLSVAIFPTVFVLDRDGTIVAVINDLGPTGAAGDELPSALVQLVQAIDEALGNERAVDQ